MRLLFLLIAFLNFFPIFFEAIAQESHPTLGLVLSGGGAKGFAHIGVLKVLEEAGIRPDYITGTSMGSIIGGLYAIGYNASELDSLVRTTNWEQLLSDAIPLSEVLPEEKHDYNRFHVEFDITKEGLKTPVGFIDGHSITALISGLAMHTAGINSFDEFPIPFKCVAADLVSGNQFVFENGSLATALRASMAIPSIFAPVFLDSMILVDGGVLNNFPVLLCKNMGADIIIGVHVGTPDDIKFTDFNTPISVLTSATMIGNNLSLRLQSPYVDYLITPDMSAFHTASFFDSEDIIAQGEIAARAMLPELIELSEKLKVKETVALPRTETIFVSQIIINGIERTTQRFLLSNLGFAVGDSITTADLEKGISQIVGTRYYKAVSYKLTPQREGSLITIQVKEAERSQFKASVHYDNVYKAGLVTNFTLRNILLRGNRLSTTFDISEKPRINTSIINYFGQNQRTASKLNFDYENNYMPVHLEDGTKYGIFSQNYFSLSAGLTTSIKTKWELNAFVETERSVLVRQSGFYELFSSGVKKFGNSFLSSSFDATRHTLNHQHFPTKGSKLFFHFKFFLDFDQVYKGNKEGKPTIEEGINIGNKNAFYFASCYQPYLSISPKIVWNSRINAVYASSPLPVTALSYVGGMPYHLRNNDVSFAGLSSREKIVQNYLLLEMNLKYQIQRKLYASLIMNGLFSQSDTPPIIDYVRVGKGETIFGYGLQFEYYSLLGPIRIGRSESIPRKGARWYLGLGYNF